MGRRQRWERRFHTCFSNRRVTCSGADGDTDGRRRCETAPSLRGRPAPGRAPPWFAQARAVELVGLASTL